MQGPRTLFVWPLLIAAMIAGCGVESGLEKLSKPQTPAATPTAEKANAERIRIASFNIQVFGTGKLEKPAVMKVLSQVVRRFDVVAIQEIRAADQTVLDEFLKLINADGSQFNYIIGPRLGRTVSKEQYAFLYDTRRVEADTTSVYTAADPQDLLHREPLVTHFRSATVPTNQSFSFKLVNIHTDPDETDTELDALAAVYQAVAADGSGEDDIILLGDLNVDEYHLGLLGRLPGVACVVTGVPTNTRGNKTYDNLVFDRRATTEYTGRWGVVDLMGDYGLSIEQALEVSDHLPVWAEFNARETAGPVAARPGVPR